MPNVIREDIVRISWDIEQNPLSDITKDLDKLQNKIKKVGGDQKKLKQLNKEFKSLNKQRLTQLSKSIDNVTKKIGSGMVSAAKKAGQALATIGTAAGGAAIAGATMGVNYNAQMETYQTSFEVMTGSAEKAQQTVSKLQKMGASTPFEMTDLAETTQLLMNYGFTADDAIGRMSMLGDISQGNADKMNSIATAYGQMSSAGKVSLEDVKQMIEAGFNPLQEISQTTGESMGSLYERISDGKISVDEITQSMIRSTSEGGRYFKSMEKQSKTFSGQVSTMKDNFNNMLGTMTKGLTDKLSGTALPKINEFMGTLTDAFNTGGFSGMFSTLMDALGPVGDTIQGVVDKVTAFVTNSEKMNIVKDIFSTIWEVAQNVGSIIGTIADEVWNFVTSTGTLETVKTIFEGISTAITWVKDHLGGILEVVKSVGIAFLIVGAAIKVVTTVMTIYNAIQKVFKTIQLISTAAQLGFNAAMLACPITWIVVAIVALVAIIVLLVRNWDKVKEVAIKCWNAIKEAFGKLAAWFNTNVVQPVVEFFTGLWDKIKTGASNTVQSVADFFSGIWDKICSVFSSVVAWVKENFVSIIAFIINPFAGVFSYLYDHCEGFRNIVNNVVNAIKNFFMNLWYFIVGVATYIKEGICAAWSFIAGWVNTNVIQPVVRFFTNLWNKIKFVVQSVWNAICDIWGLVASWVSTNIIQPVVNFFTQLWTKIITIVRNVWNTICSVWGLISSWVSTNIIQPVVNFFTQLWNKITTIVRNVWNTIVNIWNAIPGWVNSNIVQPVVNFFTNLWNKITEIVNNVWNSICDIWGQISGWVDSNIIQPVMKFFSGLWDKITGGVSSVKETIVGAFQSAWDTVTGIWEGITGFFSKLWDGVKNIVGKIIGKGKEATGAANSAKAANNYRGGLISSPTLSWVGEKGAEMIIPLTNYKNRGLSLWERAGQMLGVQPSPQISVSSPAVSLPSYSPGSAVTSSSSTNTENNNYSPQFTLNLSGTVDRTTQRTVKNWIKEALQETFDGMGRTNPRLTEV